MKTFQKKREFGGSGRSAGGRDFGGGKPRNNVGGFGHAAIHKAVCADCGASCEVPFRPSGSKPVYCSMCFRNKDNSSAERRTSPERGRFERPEYSRPERAEVKPDNSRFERLEAKLDQILRALEGLAVAAPARPKKSLKK